MSALLRLVIPTVPPSPRVGGTEIVGGCLAFPLEPIYQSLVRQRDRLTALRLPDDLEAVVHRLMARLRERTEVRIRQAVYQPLYDREAHLAELREEKELRRLQSDLGKQKACARVLAELSAVEGAVQGGTDLEVKARLFASGRSVVEERCRASILQGVFAWAECGGCGQRLIHQECGKVEWSVIAAPRAGIGGERLVCPLGHVIYATNTWVS